MNKLSRRNKALLAIMAVVVLVSAGMIFDSITTKNISLAVDGKIVDVETKVKTVEEVLAENGVALAATDQVLPALSSEINDGVEIKILRSIDYKITADGKTEEFTTIPMTVNEALSNAGISLNEKDIVTPALTEMVSENAEIKVERVTEKTIKVQNKIAPNVVTKKDDTLEKGIKRTVSKGVNGISEEEYLVTMIDGKVAKREILSSKVIKEPKDKVVKVGTISSVTKDGVNFEFKEAIKVKSYAYTGGGRTASGTKARVGAIAVDPKVIPLGTKLYVEGYGFCVAEDTGGAIKGNKVDLYMETEKECRNWGVRNVKVYIIK